MTSIPPDIVPRRPAQWTAEQLRALDAAVGSEVELREPVFVEGPDGTPAGVEIHVSSGTLARPVLTLREVRSAGLTPADVPNISVVDSEGMTDDQHE